MELTLSEAAKAVKRTRQALAIAIQKGKVSASKDDKGQWRIDSAELFRVYDPVASGDVKEDAELKQLRVKLQAVEEMRRRDLEALAEVRADRDAWRTQAERLMRALPEGRQTRSFWRRIFGG